MTNFTIQKWHNGLSDVSSVTHKTNDGRELSTTVQNPDSIELLEDLSARFPQADGDNRFFIVNVDWYGDILARLILKNGNSNRLSNRFDIQIPRGRFDKRVKVRWVGAGGEAKNIKTYRQVSIKAHKVVDVAGRIADEINVVRDRAAELRAEREQRTSRKVELFKSVVDRLDRAYGGDIVATFSEHSSFIRVVDHVADGSVIDVYVADAGSHAEGTPFAHINGHTISVADAISINRQLKRAATQFKHGGK